MASVAMKALPTFPPEPEGFSSPDLEEKFAEPIAENSIEDGGEDEDAHRYYARIMDVGPWYCKQIKEHMENQGEEFEKSQPMTFVEVVELFENISKQITAVQNKLSNLKEREKNVDDTTSRESMASQETLEYISHKTEDIQKDLEMWVNNNDIKFADDNSGLQKLVDILESDLKKWAETTIHRLKENIGPHKRSIDANGEEKNDTKITEITLRNLGAVRKKLVGVTTKTENLKKLLDSLKEETKNDIIAENDDLKMAVDKIFSWTTTIANGLHLLDVTAKIEALPKLEKDIETIQLWFPELQQVIRDVEQQQSPSPETITITVLSDLLVSLNGELKFHPSKWSVISKEFKEKYLKCVIKIQNDAENALKELGNPKGQDKMVFEKIREETMETLANRLQTNTEPVSNFEINDKKVFQGLRPHEKERIRSVIYQPYYKDCQMFFKCVTKMAKNVDCNSAVDYCGIFEYCHWYIGQLQTLGEFEELEENKNLEKKVAKIEQISQMCNQLLNSMFDKMIGEYKKVREEVVTCNKSASPGFSCDVNATYHYCKHSDKLGRNNLLGDKNPSGKYTPASYFDLIKTMTKDLEDEIEGKHMKHRKVIKEILQEGEKIRYSLHDYNRYVKFSLIRPRLRVNNEKGVVATLFYDPALKLTGSYIPVVKVTASPASPPFFLATIVSVLQSKDYSVVIKPIHSSRTTDKPKYLLKVLSKRGQSKVKITLLWMEEDGDCEMTSPNFKTAIKGEVNILRYLARVFDEVFLYERSTNVAAIDLKLDIIASLPRNGESLLKSLTKGLDNTANIVGDDVTIADIALFSYLRNGERDKDSQGREIVHFYDVPEVKKWIGAMAEWSTIGDK